MRLPAFSFKVRLGEEAIRLLAQQFVVAVFEFPRLWPAFYKMQCSSKHTQSNESQFGSLHKYVQIHFPTHLQQIERFPQFYETKNYIELCLVTLCVGNLPKNYILFSKKTVTLKVW